jgi:hypothetical protein
MDRETSARKPAVPLKYTVAIACGVVVLLALVGVWRSAAGAARERQWRNNQDVVAQAIKNYRSDRGNFPPASVLDENGQPMHSWRVLLVPFIQQNLFYSHYDLDEPWNGPHNQRLLQGYVDVDGAGDKEIDDVTDVRYSYLHPAYSLYEDNFHTDLVMVVDPNRTPTRNTGSDRGRQVWLHAGDEVMFVGVPGSDIHWMEPRDMTPEELISLSKASKNSSKSSPHITDSFVVKQDETVQFFNEEETLERLQQMQLHSNVESNSDQEKGAGPKGN